MEFLTLLIIFFVISRIGEMLKGGTRPPQRPMPRRPPPGAQLPQPRQPGTQETSPTRTERDVAADMIPDELWELLTGQPRPRRVPAPPQPAPVPARRPASFEADVDEEGTGPEAFPDEAAQVRETLRSHERDVQAEIQAAQHSYEQVLSEREKAAKVVSLETELVPEPVRHRRFHERMEASQPVAAAAPRLAETLGLRGGAELRRALILREVLGPPKALEEEAGRH